MLDRVAVVLILLWLVGLLTGHAGRNIIHILPIVAFTLLGVRLAVERRREGERQGASNSGDQEADAQAVRTASEEVSAATRTQSRPSRLAR